MNVPVPAPSVSVLRPEAELAPTSGIVDVFNYGRNRPGLIPLWVGEGDLPTPAFICDAATRSLAAGETFYTYQRGIPELREALARYHERVYGQAADPERFFVTSGGMHAIQTAVRLVAGAGDEVLVPTPAWPNFVGAITVAGARPVSVPLESDESGWRLDLGRLAAAITPATRALVINSPANPTGWTASAADLGGILDLARSRGLWIVADEIYGRFVYDTAPKVGERAPSFRDLAEPQERVLFVQTFSKNWAMTGWRLGWLEAPAALGQVIENLIQYSSSGTPVFLQRAGIVALDEGESFLNHQIARARRGREIVGRLSETGKIVLPAPAGAFYAFLRVPGGSDARAIAMRLIDEANVGLAPGTAFGDAGQGYLRLCFARKAEDLEEAVRRLSKIIT
jgi:aspartate/methionine/tyrosine aminotransferase